MQDYSKLLYHNIISKTKLHLNNKWNLEILILLRTKEKTGNSKNEVFNLLYKKMKPHFKI